MATGFGPSAALRLPPGQDRGAGEETQGRMAQSWPPSSTARKATAPDRRAGLGDQGGAHRWRGLDKVAGEWDLVALAYNCKRSQAQAGDGRVGAVGPRPIQKPGRPEASEIRRPIAGPNKSSRFRRTSIAPLTDDSLNHRNPSASPALLDQNIDTSDATGPVQHVGRYRPVRDPNPGRAPNGGIKKRSRRTVRKATRARSDIRTRNAKASSSRISVRYLARLKAVHGPIDPCISERQGNFCPAPVRGQFRTAILFHRPAPVPLSARFCTRSGGTAAEHHQCRTGQDHSTPSGCGSPRDRARKTWRGVRSRSAPVVRTLERRTPS